MTQKRFASRGTVRKLETVFDYADFYTTALGGKFRLKYLDVFAGTGSIPSGDDLPLLDGLFDYDKFVSGSAIRALELKRPFDEYHFSDLKNANVRDLSLLKQKHPNLENRISINKADANAMVDEFCANLKANERALAFLDPFGHQLSWDSLSKLAATKKVDVWYLFPAGSVLRQIKQNGQILPQPEPSLDIMFGSTEWKTEFVKKEVQTTDLFGHASLEDVRTATANSITRYMIERMRGIFEGGVLDSWLPTGRDRRHTFSLMFAWSNPSEAATSLARRVGKEIMRSR